MSRGSYRRLRSKSKPADNRAFLSESGDGAPSTAYEMPGLSKSDIEAIFVKCFDSNTIVDKLVTKLVDTIKSEVVDVLSEALNKAQEEINDLKVELTSLKKKVVEIEEGTEIKRDDLEQYTRRTNIRVFGIPEKEGEDTDKLVADLCKDTLKVDMPVERFSRTHRVGRQLSATSNGKQRWRPIIVRFLSYRDRRTVFDAKKMLKGTGITIREDLTARRMEVYQAAVDRYGIRNTWTLDGRVLWIDENKKRGVATCLADLK